MRLSVYKMNRTELIAQIKTKNTFLCVGLDPDLKKIPKQIIENEKHAIFEFNKKIIDATAPYCVAFKPNNAFYEAHGLTGIENLEKTISYIKSQYPSHFLIIDAKRGDIGNSSGMYAQAYLKTLNADAITVTPYMGSDSVKPFLELKNKWAIVLGLTSNEGSADFQQLKLNGKDFYLTVIEKCSGWGNENNMMFVIGATKCQMLAEVRKIIPNHFLLVPGVGSQGGSLQDVCKYGMNKDVGLLVNSSRGIIYASTGKDFTEKAGLEAKKIAVEMKQFIKTFKIK